MSRLPQVRPKDLVKALLKAGFKKTAMIMYKIVTFVPIKDADKMRKAMGDAGAGDWGKYYHASFSSRGIGRFIPSEGAHPAIGQIGKQQEVEEERIEVICQKEKLKDVVTAIKKTHPYEEVPIEIYQLIDEEDLYSKGR